MRAALLLLAPALLLAGCSKPKELYVDHAWVRLGAGPKSPAAGYFTIHGGPKDETLISVSTDIAIKTEIHDSGENASMSAMRPIRSLPIPANSTVEFKPGGRHVMFFDLNPIIKPGAGIELTITFGNGERILQTAHAYGPGEAVP